MFTTISVPLDGSSFGEYALPWAAAIARRTGGRLELLHVHRPQLPGEPLEALTPYQWEMIVQADDAADAEAREREEQRMRALAEGLRAGGLHASAAVLHGAVADTLTAHVHRYGTRLLVLSTHGRGGHQHGWLGSITDALVRQTHVPALLLRPREDAPPPEDAAVFRRILAPVDGSPFSETVLPLAAEMARIMDAELTLLHAARPNGPVTGSVADYLRDLAGRLRDRAPSVTVEVELAWNAAAAILDRARHGRHDLVAMATHGWGGVRHFMLGSTADKVLRGSHLPLLLFRPHPAPHTVPFPGSLVREEMVPA